ncbi:MAG: 2-dehydro-3-deoxygalactonokinase [Pseudomonadota bacterium]
MRNGGAISPEWIAVDWGTSNLRAWAMQGGDPLDEASSDRGMGTLTRDAFEPALLDLIAPWLAAPKTTVVACGMVGSRQGWAEAAYGAAPCGPLGANLTRPRVESDRIAVHIVPGIKQPSPPDVMRGEETQIAGFLRALPGFDGVLCMPGTHTKWVQISAGEIVSFRTFMTGEMFALLSESSVLRHSVRAGWQDDAFGEAVSDALSKPEAMAARLFEIRADDLLNAPGEGAAKARLSGLLIGAELAAARPYWLGQRVALIGAGTLSDLYAAALAPQGVVADKADVTACTLAGLHAAYTTLEETVT